MIRFPFDNTYARDLPGFYESWQPERSPQPELLYFNSALAEELGLDLNAHEVFVLAELFAGNQLPGGAQPIAQAYAGHQFGHFNPQLGDGRALLTGEVIDCQGRRRDIAFKGSGRTPFSRSGDGKAAMGPMLREVLIGEAMHHLGVPTTRTLAVAGTGESVYREQALPGAVLTRVASSHIRIGTFEYFAARGEHDQVRHLADYTIARHDPQLLEMKDRYLQFLRAVTQRQAELVVQWMGLGFIHGVMNTDNVSIAGETIDYGPCAFIEAYNPDAVFSSIDQHGRYAYNNQPRIAQWNLARLAETLLPLLADNEQEGIESATKVVESFSELYQVQWLAAARAKLGLSEQVQDKNREDTVLIEEWLSLLQIHKVDFTLAWRSLADAAEGQLSSLYDLFAERAALDEWLSKWQARCASEDASDNKDAGQKRAQVMRNVNPWLIPRNHRVEEALAAASAEGNLDPFEQLLKALQKPYTKNAEFAEYAESASDSFTKCYQTFCGT